MSVLASASADADIAVVGAGVAGLAAAGLLRGKGLRVALLERGARTGGRAWTDRPAALGGAPFDHGPQWLHAAQRNPLIALAQSRGVAVHPDTPWDDRSLVMDPPGRPAASTAYDDAEARWQDVVRARLGGADTSLARAAQAVADDPWTATIEAWEGAIIAAGDADELSLHDWHANALEGENFVAPGGLGALVAACLAPDAGEVRLGVRVTGIEAEPGGVRVLTDQGVLRAGAALVTVSTGVLRAEAIAFAPALPNHVLRALDGLPMGLLSKIALRAADAERFGLKPATGVFRRLEARGAPFLSTIFWAGGTDLAVGFVGGRAAWALAGRPDEAASFMLDDLAATLGHDVRRHLVPGLATRWGEDACFLGAYAYATPGNAGARAVLGAPLWDGRLMFAGEACATDGLAGTVAGAYLSGRHAAQAMLGCLQPARPDGFPGAARSV